ncbi:uncharacterized protein LOC111733687 [Pteropus vampyrus]|uniref:Uncharacterized protein LOC111733687 n=1 Tax=Pteropus vampyrus TaxID=132908 RepID=A0A6P6C274_PTEVA|nr:uncharacterized protein LOC111733687 [Pteropus vampyrus]
MPRSPRHSGSDRSLWVSLRVPGKEPARRLREGKRVRDSIPISLSLCRRGREARGPDTGTATSRQSGKPDARFRSRKRKERTRRTRGRVPAAAYSRPGAGTATAAPPRPASGHASRPGRARRSHSPRQPLHAVPVSHFVVFWLKFCGLFPRSLSANKTPPPRGSNQAAGVADASSAIFYLGGTSECLKRLHFLVGHRRNNNILLRI